MSVSRKTSRKPSHRVPKACLSEPTDNTPRGDLTSEVLRVLGANRHRRYDLDKVSRLISELQGVALDACYDEPSWKDRIRTIQRGLSGRAFVTDGGVSVFFVESVGMVPNGKNDTVSISGYVYHGGTHVAPCTWTVPIKATDVRGGSLHTSFGAGVFACPILSKRESRGMLDKAMSGLRTALNALSKF